MAHEVQLRQIPIIDGRLDKTQPIPEELGKSIPFEVNPSDTSAEIESKLLLAGAFQLKDAIDNKILSINGTKITWDGEDKITLADAEKLVRGKLETEGVPVLVIDGFIKHGLQQSVGWYGHGRIKSLAGQYGVNLSAESLNTQKVVLTHDISFDEKKNIKLVSYVEHDSFTILDDPSLKISMPDGKVISGKTVYKIEAPAATTSSEIPQTSAEAVYVYISHEDNVESCAPEIHYAMHKAKTQQAVTVGQNKFTTPDKLSGQIQRVEQFIRSAEPKPYIDSEFAKDILTICRALPLQTHTGSRHTRKYLIQYLTKQLKDTLQGNPKGHVPKLSVEELLKSAHLLGLGKKGQNNVINFALDHLDVFGDELNKLTSSTKASLTKTLVEQKAKEKPHFWWKKVSKARQKNAEAIATVIPKIVSSLALADKNLGKVLDEALSTQGYELTLEEKFLCLDVYDKLGQEPKAKEVTVKSLEELKQDIEESCAIFLPQEGTPLVAFKDEDIENLVTIFDYDDEITANHKVGLLKSLCIQLNIDVSKLPESTDKSNRDLTHPYAAKVKQELKNQFDLAASRLDSLIAFQQSQKIEDPALLDQMIFFADLFGKKLPYTPTPANDDQKEDSLEKFVTSLDQQLSDYEKIKKGAFNSALLSNETARSALIKLALLPKDPHGARKYLEETANPGLFTRVFRTLLGFLPSNRKAIDLTARSQKIISSPIPISATAALQTQRKAASASATITALGKAPQPDAAALVQAAVNLAGTNTASTPNGDQPLSEAQVHVVAVFQTALRQDSTNLQKRTKDDTNAVSPVTTPLITPRPTSQAVISQAASPEETSRSRGMSLSGSFSGSE